MKLPNAESAIVDIDKLRDYCLSPIHPRGRHKARVFAAALDLRPADSEELKQFILRAALASNASLSASDRYGDRYTVDFETHAIWQTRYRKKF